MPSCEPLSTTISSNGGAAVFASTLSTHRRVSATLSCETTTTLAAGRAASPGAVGVAGDGAGAATIRSSASGASCSGRRPARMASGRSPASAAGWERRLGVETPHAASSSPSTTSLQNHSRAIVRASARARA